MRFSDEVGYRNPKELLRLPLNQRFGACVVGDYSRHGLLMLAWVEEMGPVTEVSCSM
jgi:hypothetical protein